MVLSAFTDKGKPPREAEVMAVLGRSSIHWRAIRDVTGREYAPIEYSWIHAGAKWGWALKIQSRKRTLLYLTPCQKHFIAGFALGEKAVLAAQAAGLPKAIVGVIQDSKKYAEGRAVRLEVRNRLDRDAILRLVSIKAEN